FKFNVAAPLDLLVTSLLLVVTVVVTVASYWHTHIRGRTPGRTFLYAQALFDVALVTTIVHITGGPASDFSTLYVPLIVVTALLMPPASTALVTALVGLVYFADVIFGHQLAPAPGITLQPGLLVVVGAVSAYRVRRADRTFPIGVTTTTHEEPGGAPPPRVTAIFTDISDSKRLEELHLRAERLEAVAELSSSLAHEIRNPLASIRSSVEQLSRAKRADAEDKFLTGLIMHESDRLSRLLSEFLDFSRVRVTECRPLDLRTVAVAVIELVREHPDCPEGARIDLAGDPTPMEGDEDLLHRVVMNLVLNAVQAAVQ